MLNPGHLVKGHQAIENDCLSCHTPFRGVTSVQCISCHKPDDISVKNVAGALLPKKSTKVLFHRGLDASSCIECHTDHKGLDVKKTVKSFRHESLAPSLRQDCLSCHKEQKPADDLHRYAQGSCAECHRTAKWKPATFDHKNLTGASGRECIKCHRSDRPNDELHRSVAASGCAECHRTAKWKPATFDHKNLTGSSGRACINCHKSDRPNDELHRSVAASGCAECHRTSKWKPATFDHKNLTAASGKACINCHKSERPNDSMHRASDASCGTCHATSRWKPATFDHNRYFRLDSDHRASCKTCHTDPGNYKTYTCYNCHEHTQSKMAAVHREEGISNYQNCMKCHRSGSKEGGRREDD